MSHPDPCYDPENSEEDDMNYADDVDASNYDDHEDFYRDDLDEYRGRELDDDMDNSGEIDWHDEDDDSMDGDHESALSSAGWGTDEDYGYYGDVDYREDFHADEAIGYVDYNEDGPYYD